MKSSGEMVSITADDFFQALEDPIAPKSRKLIEHANKEYAKEIRKLFVFVLSVYLMTFLLILDVTSMEACEQKNLLFSDWITLAWISWGRMRIQVPLPSSRCFFLAHFYR